MKVRGSCVRVSVCVCVCMGSCVFFGRAPVCGEWCIWAFSFSLSSITNPDNSSYKKFLICIFCLSKVEGAFYAQPLVTPLERTLAVAASVNAAYFTLF